jgi:poly(A) polymerase
VSSPVVEHPVLPVLEELSHRYAGAGHRLALTGGATRDFLLGRQPYDFDLISDAQPEDTEKLLLAWAGNATRSLNRFGVVSTTYGEFKVQVLTFHSPRDWFPDFDRLCCTRIPCTTSCYVPTSPFNTGTVLFPGTRWIDPYGAAADVARRILRPPIDPFVTIAGNRIRWSATRDSPRSSDSRWRRTCWQP